MIGTVGLIVISVKTKSGIPFLLAALINAATAKRMRQFELMRELGTLASKIEDRRLLRQDTTVLEHQYNTLLKLYPTQERITSNGRNHLSL